MLSRLHQIENMLKNEPNDSFLTYALALEYVKANNLEKAIDLIETLLLKDENYLGAYYQLGKFYEEKQQIEKAISTYHKGIIIAKQQKNRKALSELNEALFLAGKDKQSTLKKSTPLKYQMIVKKIAEKKLPLTKNYKNLKQE